MRPELDGSPSEPMPQQRRCLTTITAAFSTSGPCGQWSAPPTTAPPLDTSVTPREHFRPQKARSAWPSLLRGLVGDERVSPHRACWWGATAQGRDRRPPIDRVARLAHRRGAVRRRRADCAERGSDVSRHRGAASVGIGQVACEPARRVPLLHARRRPNAPRPETRSGTDRDRWEGVPTPRLPKRAGPARRRS